jgi:hypothetical protein
MSIFTMLGRLGPGSNTVLSGVANLISKKLLARIRVYLWIDLAEWLELLAAKAQVATVLGSIPVSSDTKC